MDNNRAIYESSSRAIVVRAQLKEGERGNYISYMSITLIHPTHTKKSLGMYGFKCMGTHVRAFIFGIQVVGYIYMVKELLTSLFHILTKLYVLQYKYPFYDLWYHLWD